MGWQFQWKDKNNGILRSRAQKKCILTNNKKIQVNIFNYLGCSLSYVAGKDVEIKISKCLKIAGLINPVFKLSKVQKHAGLTICNTQLYRHFHMAAETGHWSQNTKPTLQPLKWAEERNTLGWTTKETKNTKINKNKTYIGHNFEI